MAAPRSTCGSERRDHAARFGLRLVDEARGEVGAPAAQRSRRVGVGAVRPRDVDAIARRAQHVRAPRAAFSGSK